MKNHLFLVNLACLGMVLFAGNATAQVVSTPQILAQNLSDLERRELQILRQERQAFQKEKEIHNSVKAEVDRTLTRTTNLINTLLFVIILFPIVTAFGIWLLRRSIINQLTTELKQELQAEVAKQTTTFKQELDQLQGEYNNYFSQLQVWANSHFEIASNQAPEIPEEQQFLPETKHFIATETQTLMAQDQYEISSLNSDEQTIAAELDHSQNQAFTVEDYISLGNSYLAKSRYQEAIEAYNAALKIERNLPEARYQNAKAYALRGSINPAIGNLQWAIDLAPQYKEIAQTDPAFDYIRNDEQFQQIVNY